MSKRRVLSLFDVLCLGINAIVGSGIYAFPGLLAALLGPASFLAFGLCGLASGLVGLCFVEAASIFRSSGGPYVYTRVALGKWPAYLVGWTCWAAAVLSWAAVARAMAPYLAHLWPAVIEGRGGILAAVAITFLLGLVNVWGIKPGAYTLDSLTVAKILPLVVLGGAGLGSLRLALLSPFAPRGFAALPQAAYSAMFAFQGFEVVPVPAGETDNPRRNAPLALAGSLLFATLLYMVLQVAAVGSTPNLAGATDPLAYMGLAVLGEVGGRMMAVAAVISMLGFCAGVALAAPRYLEALANDRHLPAALAARHPRYGTPHWAILITTGLTMLLLTLLDFGRLADLAVLTVGVQYLATCIAVPLLRLRRPDLTRTFRLPLGPVIPLLATAVTLWFGAQASAQELYFFGLILLAGLVVGILGWSGSVQK